MIIKIKKKSSKLYIVLSVKLYCGSSFVQMYFQATKATETSISFIWDTINGMFRFLYGLFLLRWRGGGKARAVDRLLAFFARTLTFGTFTFDILSIRTVIIIHVCYHVSCFVGSFLIVYIENTKHFCSFFFLFCTRIFTPKIYQTFTTLLNHFSPFCY